MALVKQEVQLGALLAPWLTAKNVPAEYAQLLLTAMTLDSRQVTAGCLFAAVNGHTVDGRRFITNAIAAGASAIVAEAEGVASDGEIQFQDGIIIIYLHHLGHKLSAIAGRFYAEPDSKLKLYAVTGTNGKTTISQLLAQWADLIGYRAGVMGTTGNGLLTDLQPAANTTGSAIEIQQTLAELVTQGANFAAMEVSSHGLVQGRVSTLHFVASIFTNLSRDHLDYHGDMAHYAAAKKSLFTEHDSGVAVINADDAIGQQWLADLPQAVAVAMNAEAVAAHSGPKLWATAVDFSTQGVTICFESSWGNGNFTAPLVGSFNATNLLLALATLLVSGHSLPQLLAVAPRLQAVIGRMEVFQAPQADKAMMVVDYAHTPDALDKALQALRVHCDGQLWCLFGCGGDRDSGKRPMMAAIAERYADHIILVDDNPRSEDPLQIMLDMQAGLTVATAATIIHDRAQACAYALTHAKANDIILVAGKGHEDYQILADRTIHYSDRETVAALFRELP
ncbi:UDP-N-acetylmuramoyl-L-alanyl-D-glutamate--2,6-diaminopimelate ligase [Photobacterium kishitanii]|uniref:UDP-N-acetylmuramoyl-L-alanyl-D-glutamate--2, 6-diaminopimelate ligase n=1 Tax=Photobacterium kishitanii TaxID=318456 RepID=UPI0005D36591|nr:UDP-N-acetylmuramoyl-L-alanyl-D-glutamate--2,6-diaminopimelate ligase [Photobacterium kishitanii]KJG10483.1 UDP-N-acetylmuramoylalanyl-D-glutamate--2,6-diaminopimelate ligase [Photobacterium kishitanii]PSV05176.1 UDP-N-acetylmuramoyl-L-alanyl-D-glutamate--2,6-diaminopimelate ligase [Photobacterium kishitanii]PSV75996.1 UDP-N-acetylmuramoyl-L-alanyl-D-glutamate--2,6-diaminopimelate ligase [Photobacterium kishitanii]